MLRKLTRTGIAAMALAGVTVAGAGVSVQAQMKPRIGQGEEVVIDYYSDATHSKVVGEYGYGCTYYFTGSRSSYTSTNEYAC